MKSTYFYSNTNMLLHRKLRYLLFFFFLTVSTSSIFAVNNLIVSGITTPTEANGTYVFHSNDAWGKPIWKHSTATFYIYYDNTTYFTWNIDSNTNSDNVLFFTEGGGLLTPVGASFSAESGASSAGVSVVEGGVPEITVLGNGNDIGDGNNDPTYSRYTKFGSMYVTSGFVTRSFTIKNDGLAALTISNITISGANASDFTITSTAATSVAASGQTTFSVKFDPSAIGSRTATISIANNDADEGTYDFSIQGYGYTPGDLVVSNITTPTAVNGVYIHKGVLNGQYEYWQHSSGSYYIYRSISDLQIVWFIDTDTDPTTFLFKQYYSTDPESPKVVETWVNSSSVTSIINIMDYVAAPEIKIIGNNIPIDNNDVAPDFGDYTHLGTVEVQSATKTRTFTIQNIGGTSLTLNGVSPYVTISGANASDFTVTAIPTSTISSGNSTTFQITFDPSGVGTRTATVSISNTDGDEGSFQFAIKGDGLYPQSLTVAGMTSSSAAANGSYVYQGISNHFAYWKHSTANYYIYNEIRTDDGHNEWNIDIDMISMNSNVLFRTHNNITSALPTDQTWTFGNGTPTITILAPEMNVKGNAVSIVDGDVTPSAADYTDFGSQLVSTGTVVKTFTIENTSAGLLYLSSPTISGANASDFTVTAQPTSTVAATTGTTTFTVQFDPSGVGTRTATVSIANSDADENPYNFSIQGNGYSSPTTTTNAATSITDTEATLNGSINANTASTVVTFEYGLTTSYGNSVTASQSPVTGISNTAVTYTLTGLSPNTTYHYRVIGVNAGGTTNGLDQTFTTSISTGIKEYVAISDNLPFVAFRNATGQIEIKRNDASAEGVVTICNAYGQRLFSGTTTGATTVINKPFRSGIYVVTLNVVGSLTTQKVILK